MQCQYVFECLKALMKPVRLLAPEASFLRAGQAARGGGRCRNVWGARPLGNTPMDEATRVGARPCAAYLQQHAAAVRRRAVPGCSSTPLEEAQRSSS